METIPDLITPTAEDVLRLYRKGELPSEIAYELGVTREFVYAKLLQAGVKVHPLIGDSVCDSYSGTCGRIADILDDEVLIEPITISETGEEVVGRPTIKAKKVNLTSDHIRKHIITLHEQGLSAIEIATKLGTTYGFVYHRLRQAGLKPHPAPAYVPTEDIIALHKKGLSPSEIAARLGITYGTVYSRLLRAGITPHPAPPPPVPTEDIIALHKEGLSPPEIAARLNVSSYLVHARLRRAGFKPNPPPLWEKAKRVQPRHSEPPRGEAYPQADCRKAWPKYRPCLQASARGKANTPSKHQRVRKYPGCAG
ncbi:hypothetical protein ES708_15164 [subsurface metagenome]